MDLINFILNVAGLLLWLNWRAIGLSAVAKPPGTSLLRTLKRAEPHGSKHWLSLAALAALLAFRALAYWQIGPSVGWMPGLSLKAISLTLRSDSFERMLLFSLFSFGLTLAIFYCWLLLISIANRRVTDADMFQKLGRLKLGWVEHWPLVLKLLLPFCLATLLWYAATPLLNHLGFPRPVSSREIWQKGMVLGLAAYLLWNYVIVGALLLHVLNSHVYLGANPFWSFVDVTARNLVAPIRWLPLRIGKMDFAPIAGIALVFLADEYGSRGLTNLFQHLPI